MNKEDFLKKMKEGSIRESGLVNSRTENDGDTWCAPTLDDVPDTASESFFQKCFVEEYWARNRRGLKGYRSSIFIAECVKDLLHISYNERGIAAIVQFVGRDDKVHTYYCMLMSINRWTSAIDRNHPVVIAAFENVPTIEQGKIDCIVCRKSENRIGVQIMAPNLLTMPMEGFNVTPEYAVDFKILESSTTFFKCHIKSVINGGDRLNRLIEVTIRNGELCMDVTNVEEDWWGLHLPDFRTPNFNLPTPYNKSIHTHMDPAVYAGEYLWVVDGPNTISLKINGKWVPVRDLGDWDIASMVHPQAAEEYQLYESLS